MRDNPTEVLNYLVEIFETNYTEQTKREVDTTIEVNMPKQPTFETSSI